LDGAKLEDHLVKSEKKILKDSKRSQAGFDGPWKGLGRGFDNEQASGNFG
jgi:hypothetical protein